MAATTLKARAKGRLCAVQQAKKYKKYEYDYSYIRMNHKDILDKGEEKIKDKKCIYTFK